MIADVRRCGASGCHVLYRRRQGFWGQTQIKEIFFTIDRPYLNDMYHVIQIVFGRGIDDNRCLFLCTVVPSSHVHLACEGIIFYRMILQNTLTIRNSQLSVGYHNKDFPFRKLSVDAYFHRMPNRNSLWYCTYSYVNGAKLHYIS
jgi:hypothetical protein